MQNDFMLRMEAMLDADDYRAFCDAIALPPKRIARLNPIKRVDDEAIRAELGGFPLIPEGVKPGSSPLHALGAFYVQEPAAAAVAGLIAPLLPPRAAVLDVCAAPGGKVTAAAASRPDCFFAANEVVFSRAKILMSNVERLGLRNVSVTSLSPDAFERYGTVFDAIIADVPCSGEGMVRKTELLDSYISTESVEACADRARKILCSCDRCLKPGGILIFSTCTFNLTENEEQAEFLRTLGYEPVEPAARPALSRRGFGLPEAVRFFPQDGGGEGHFCCILKKSASREGGQRIRPHRHSNSSLVAQDRKRIKAAIEAIKGVTSENFDPDDLEILRDGVDILPPEYPLGFLPAVRKGVRAVTFFGDRAEPHHNLATAAAPEYLVSPLALTPATVLDYLSGAVLPAPDHPKGFHAVTYLGLPLGLVKISEGLAKNKYGPKK